MTDTFQTIDAKRAKQQFGFSRTFFYDLLNNPNINVREYRLGKRRFANLHDLVQYIESREVASEKEENNDRYISDN